MYSVTFDHRRARGGSSGGGEIVRHGHGMTHLQCNMLRRPDGVMKEKQTHTHKHIHTHTHTNAVQSDRGWSRNVSNGRGRIVWIGDGMTYLRWDQCMDVHTCILPPTHPFIHPPVHSSIHLHSHAFNYPFTHPPIHPSEKNINAIHLHSCSYTIHLHHSFAPCMD